MRKDSRLFRVSGAAAPAMVVASAWVAGAGSIGGCFGSSGAGAPGDDATSDGAASCAACDAAAPDAYATDGPAEAARDSPAEVAVGAALDAGPDAPDGAAASLDAEACLDAGTPYCMIVIANNMQNAASVRLDSSNVYWVEEATGAVIKAPLGGGLQTTLAVGGGGTFDIAIDATHVYFDNGYTGVVASAPLSGDGGMVTTIASGQTTPEAIAVDTTAVYWIDQNGDALMRAPLGGVPEGGAPTVIATGPISPNALALDANNVYFATTDGAIRAASKTAADAGAGAVLVSGQDVVGLAIDASHLYWTNGGATGAVLMAPIGGLPDGGAPTTLAGPENEPTSIAVDSTNVYFTGGGNPTGYVAMAPIAGGTTTTLATGQTSPGGIAVDPQMDVYWADFAYGRVLEIVR